MCDVGVGFDDCVGCFMVEYYWCIDVEWVDFVVNVVMYVVVVDVDCMDFDLDVVGVDCLW